MTDTQCKQVPHETCQQVPKKRCNSVPHEVCTNVPETKCWQEPSEKCWDEPVEKCHKVPEEKCWQVGFTSAFSLAHTGFVAQVPHQKCWDEPREHCTQKTVSCTDFIFIKISCSGARGKEGLCANQEGSKLPQEVVKKSIERRMTSTEHLVCHCENFTS